MSMLPDEPTILPPRIPRPEPIELPPSVEQYVLEMTEIGDVIPIAPGTTPPPGWALMDGKPRQTRNHPEFAKAMKLESATFELPAPVVVRPGAGGFIVRLK